MVARFHVGRRAAQNGPKFFRVVIAVHDYRPLHLDGAPLPQLAQVLDPHSGSVLLPGPSLSSIVLEDLRAGIEEKNVARVELRRREGLGLDNAAIRPFPFTQRRRGAYFSGPTFSKPEATPPRLMMSGSEKHFRNFFVSEPSVIRCWTAFPPRKCRAQQPCTQQRRAVCGGLRADPEIYVVSKVVAPFFCASAARCSCPRQRIDHRSSGQRSMPKDAAVRRSGRPSKRRRPFSCCGNSYAHTALHTGTFPAHPACDAARTTALCSLLLRFAMLDAENGSGPLRVRHLGLWRGAPRGSSTRMIVLVPGWSLQYGWHGACKGKGQSI